ncbi:MAG: Gfo/Idh/MocA family oxidoreductase [Verrucomicrobia bacterium]|nr:Gfo/Idh/MocA family oxidoreductase [Verrucomicrobiota bacterium]
MSDKIRVLVAGCGHMGISHSRAYHKLDGFEIVGLVSRSPGSRQKLNAELGGIYPEFDNYDTALAETKPDAVSINTYPDTHAEFATKAFEAGAHVFLEKPIAETVEGAQAVVDAAVKTGKKLVIGYILRHHPSWIKFIEIARDLGKPLVMRMNLNQQSFGSNWETHKNLMNSMSPIVDCGVHYVDVMCQMTGSKPVRVNAIGARLSPEIDANMVNYGQLQVTFADGSVGWYEAGWGPMSSEEAFFVKDVWGPDGSVSIVAKSASAESKSSDVDSHSKTESLRRHYSKLGADGNFEKKDELIDLTDEPDHDELCKREQEYFLKAIHEDLDLTDHMGDAVNSLAIVLAADKAFREGRTVAF